MKILGRCVLDKHTVAMLHEWYPEAPGIAVSAMKKADQRLIIVCRHSNHDKLCAPMKTLSADIRKGLERKDRWDIDLAIEQGEND
ncbi:hypothetical protein Agabi119p4_3323 [Agaricus bisporus var. burnettii]|uniref:Uncharacterized protein n=1 Tax=Agaricus bisporus var. burnettii TaxID=192524 RepID=A0A8H7F6W1_AGABI|nr:hypothetical protein Agabi119p4_3323 [Agaricus bisporus var. burnettii]